MELASAERGRRGATVVDGEGAERKARNRYRITGVLALELALAQEAGYIPSLRVGGENQAYTRTRRAAHEKRWVLFRKKHHTWLPEHICERARQLLAEYQLMNTVEQFLESGLGGLQDYMRLEHQHPLVFTALEWLLEIDCWIAWLVGMQQENTQQSTHLIPNLQVRRKSKLTLVLQKPT